MKIDLISTLINTMQLQIVRRELINKVIGIFRHLKRFGYIHCEVTLSFFFIDSADRYVFWELCLPRHSVHHSLPTKVQ